MNEFLITAVVPLALAFVMLSLGLGLHISDFKRVVTEPKAMALGLVNQMVLLPVVAFTLCLAFDLPPEVAVGFMVVAFCPGGATSNVLTHYAGGSTPLSVSLTAVTSLISFISIPFLVALTVNYFMGDANGSVDTAALSLSLLLMAVVPAGLGVAVATFLPRVAAKLERPFSIVSFLFMTMLIVAVFALNLFRFKEYGSLLVPPVVVLLIIMLSLGVISARLFRLSPRDGTAISIESGLQNATMAIAIAVILSAQVLDVHEGETIFMIPPAIYGMLMYAFAIPFILLRRRTHKALAASAAT